MCHVPIVGNSGGWRAAWAAGRTPTVVVSENVKVTLGLKQRRRRIASFFGWANAILQTFNSTSGKLCCCCCCLRCCWYNFCLCCCCYWCCCSCCCFCLQANLKHKQIFESNWRKPNQISVLRPKVRAPHCQVDQIKRLLAIWLVMNVNKCFFRLEDKWRTILFQQKLKPCFAAYSLIWRKKQLLELEH